MPTQIDPHLYHDVQAALSSLDGKAEQLLGNCTTNLAECWMHIRTKYDGGKVINRSQSGSWEHRSMGAALQQNMGREWGLTVWKQMAEASPNKVFKGTADCYEKTVVNNRKRMATEKAKERRRQSKYMQIDDSDAARRAYSRHDDGILPNEVTDDIPQEHLKHLMDTYYNSKVAITEEKAKLIERQTRNQADDELWKSERRRRITASIVGSVAKMKASIKRSKKVAALLYSSFRGNVATCYGLTMEAETIQQYTANQKANGHPDLTVNKCGLFVSLNNHWLPATPDGSVHDPTDPDIQGILEIKNPYSARDKTLAEASTTSGFCLEKRDDKYKLKVRHDYHFQIQCQLYCTERNWCDFVLRTNRDLHIERIYRDRKWWGLQLAKLRKFFFTALLPELAHPRHRQGGIREPQDQ